MRGQPYYLEWRRRVRAIKGPRTPGVCPVCRCATTLLDVHPTCAPEWLEAVAAYRKATACGSSIDCAMGCPGCPTAQAAT